MGKLTVLHHTDHVVWNVTFIFGENGPSNKEISGLRKVVPEFKDRSLPFVLGKVKKFQKYADPYNYGNIEIKSLQEKLEEMKLDYQITSKQIGGYLPVSKDSHALLIEDEELSKEICKKMRDSGVPIICHTHID